TDLKRFEFIIRNIFNNAIKFSLSGKSVVFDQQEDTQSIIISIKDQGLGMDTNTIRSLQDKGLQKSFEGTFQEKGTGIGLLLCHEFAERIGCTITIESTLGFGSTFHIHIPK
ncbi:MAG: sensor histidine kinase, partial [Sphingobacterium siyangense]